MILKKTALLLVTSIMFIDLSAQIKQPVDYVNPFIGTEKSSHLTVWESKGATFPGVLQPFGMVQITPNGYTYADKKIKSFSFLDHFSGYFSYGRFNLMAFTDDTTSAWQAGSAFDHSSEKASPYYYQVMLKDSRINAEFTATSKIGFCKFTFPESASANLVISDVTEVKVLDSNTINGRCGDYYFIAQFSRPFNSAGPDIETATEKAGSVNLASPSRFIINYSTKDSEVILMKIGFSTTSFQGVEKNIKIELPGWDFEKTSLQTKEAWNKKLGKIEIKTPDQSTKEVFYTALYHSMFMPIILSDAGASQDNYSALFPWDTYRSKHPLITLLEPEKESDMVASVLSEYDKTGWLPTDNMMGNHNTELILDSYVKGANNFNISKACEAMSKSLITPPYARREMADFVKYKFVPASITSSVTHSLEFAYNCWAVANFLEQTGNKEKYLKEYELLIERAGYYKNSFDVGTGFMRAKTISGQWTNGGYAEGTNWTYSWYVPHDVQELINLMGGNDIFSKQLNKCFEEGQYVHDNEPPLHYAYLFNYCGQPWKTQAWARHIVESSYSTDPGGLPGNDDLGALSSWFVFSAMGFYPVTPGTTQYQIGSPVFEETTIHLSNGHDFVIKANSVSHENKYIQSATIDGVKLNRPWLTHEEIAKSKILIFEMGPEPNKKWGSDLSYKPYSMTSGTPDFVIKNYQLSARVVKADQPFNILVTVQNNSNVTGTFIVPVYLDGKSFKTISVILEPGETRTLQSPATSYYEGMHSIEIKGMKAMKLEVQKTIPTLLYSDLKISSSPIININDSTFISATVKNAGSYRTSKPVKLFVNGSEAQTKVIALKPGEEKEITFKYVASGEGLHDISIAKLNPVTINVLNRSIKIKYDYKSLASLTPLLIMDFDEEPSTMIPDFSGLGNDGIVKGNLNWVEGAFGKAIQTNGPLGNYIVFPGSSSLDQMARSTPLTMMAWVYPIDERNFADILSKGDWNSLQVKGSNRLVNFYASGWEGHQATASVPENWNLNWHHLAGVANGIDFKLYVDGKLVENKKGELRDPKGETGTANYSNSLWNIGRNETAPDRVFNGYIDDVMIFKNALTQQQIIDLMLHNFELINTK